MPFFNKRDQRRIGRAVSIVEGQRHGGDVAITRPNDGGSGEGLRLAKLKAALPAGGAAQGVLLVWDEQSQTIVESTLDPAEYITIRDRLKEGTSGGIVGTNGRRCYVTPDVSGDGSWMIVQTLFTCD